MVDVDRSPSLVEIVGEVFEMEPDELDDDTSPDNAPAWNSLGAVRLMIALQERFGIEFSSSEIMAMRSIRLIRRVLRKKGISVA